MNFVLHGLAYGRQRLRSQCHKMTGHSRIVVLPICPWPTARCTVGVSVGRCSTSKRTISNDPMEAECLLGSRVMVVVVGNLSTAKPVPVTHTSSLSGDVFLAVVYSV